MTKAQEYLIKVDPKIGLLVQRLKLTRQSKEENYFRSLCEAILSQQISTAAADTIISRFRAIFRATTFPTAKQVLATRDTKLRKAGVSRQKIGYLKDLAGAVQSGRLNLNKLKDMEDEEIISALIQVKGIGRWTAEMFMMFCLRRPDVFSVGDLGLQNAIKRVYGLKKHPNHKKMESISKAWKPHRTLAARYLWASLRKNPDVI